MSHAVLDTSVVFVNGEERALEQDSSLRAVLSQFGVDAETVRGVAVAVNDEVVPRKRWDEIELKAGDCVEVVTAKQGG